MNSKIQKSFTLVELMIVIAILAILSAIVIFALNPSEIFKKNRDSRRMADINTLNKAVVFMTSWNTMGNVSLGTSTYIYLSLPDSSSTCSSYSLATLPTGYSYSCVSSTTIGNVDGTGWIPVNFALAAGNNYIAKLPVDPTNDSNYYYSYNPGGSFELNTFFESNTYISKYGSTDGGDSNAFELGTNLQDMPQTFPHNWVRVPGNSLYGTSDFWVMQYEAKYAINGKTGSDAPTDCKNDVNYDTYDWGKACSATANVSTNVISSPMGSPIAAITHTEAKAICTALGAHLITNQEWMTIARNADQQNTNWTSGTKGTGYIFNGNSADSTRGYDGPNPDKGINRNVRSVLTLSNGSKIYDFSGNVWEHTMFDINDTLVNNLPNDGGASGWRWVELTALTTDGDFASYDDLKPTDSSWDADQGTGRVYTNTDVQSSRVLLRGGDWDYGSTAGSFALVLD